MKKKIYIFLSIILWSLIGLLACGLLEIMVFKMLFADFRAQGLWLSWSTWENTSKILMIIFIAIGLVAGYYFGQR